MEPAFDMIPNGLRRGVKVYGGNGDDDNGCLNVPGDGNCRGWGVELGLPVSMLLLNSTDAAKHKPKEGGFWRVNFSRVEWRVLVDAETGTYYKDPAYPDEDNWVWSPQGRVNMHLPDLWGILQFGGPAAQPQPSSRYYAEWPARQLAMQLYYASHAYSLSLGGSPNNGNYPQFFTDDVSALAPFATDPGSLDGQCWGEGHRGGGDDDIAPPTVELGEGGQTFVATVERNGFVATVDDRRFLTVKKK